jgi:hypothetical protein
MRINQSEMESKQILDAFANALVKNAEEAPSQPGMVLLRLNSSARPEDLIDLRIPPLDLFVQHEFNYCSLPRR